MLITLLMSLALPISPVFHETENYLPYFRVEISSDEKVWLLTDEIEGTGIYTEASCNCGCAKCKDGDSVPVIKSEEYEEVVLYVRADLGDVVLAADEENEEHSVSLSSLFTKFCVEVVGEDDEGHLLVTSSDGHLPEIIVENKSGFSAVGNE
jgi:hypothetical protein